MQHHGIVVGIDGSSGSTIALKWAAERTDEFGPLRPVHAWDYPLTTWAPAPFGGGAIPPIEQMTAAATLAAEGCIADLGDVAQEPVIVERGDAGTILSETARDANLLVIGTRGRGPVRSNVLGSVGRDCADHSTVPVVIVPSSAEDAPTSGERVVVGVDGSEHSLDALRWAVAHASDEAQITAVTSWQTPVDGPILYGVDRFDIRALKAAAQTSVNEAADTVCAETGIDGSRITRQIAEGDPRWVLQRSSDEADILVLGQRGRTGLPHFFLGSTTTALLHRPHCATVIIPG